MSIALGIKAFPATGDSISVEQAGKTYKASGRKWMHNPITKEEAQPFLSDTDQYIADGFVYGRNPEKKHGGAKGLYTAERIAKAHITRKTNTGYARAGHSDETKKKLSEARLKFNARQRELGING